MTLFYDKFTEQELSLILMKSQLILSVRLLVYFQQHNNTL